LDSAGKAAKQGLQEDLNGNDTRQEAFANEGPRFTENPARIEMARQEQNNKHDTRVHVPSRVFQEQNIHKTPFA
jgi:hypothetical protein